MTSALATIAIFQPICKKQNGSILPQRYINTADANGEFPVTDTCERNATIMSDDYVKLSFKLLEQYVFEAFSYIWYDGQCFFLKEQYRPTAKGSYYMYEMKFVSVGNMFEKHICLRYLTVIETDPEPEINMNGTLEDMAQIVLGSIHGAASRLEADQPQLFYTQLLKNIIIADDIQQGTSLQTFSFSSSTIIDVLSSLADTYEIEWWLSQESSTSIKLHLCKCERNDTIVVSDQYKETGDTLLPYASRGLLSCEYSQEWSNIPRKIIPFGSDRNITRKQALEDVNGNSMYVSYGKKLRLAHNHTYIVKDRNGNSVAITTDALGALTNAAVKSGIETTKEFDDIYPRCHFRVIGVSVQGTEHPVYTITAAAIKADGVSMMNYDEMVAEGLLPLQIEANETLSIIFESGYLNGREFEVKHDIKEVEYNGQKVMRWLLTIVPEEGGEDGVSLPFGNFVPREKTSTYEGDMFAIFHMVMPQGYITRAQEELAQAAYDELLAIEDTRPEIKCNSEPLFFANQTICLGQRVAVHSELFGEIQLDANGDIRNDSQSLFASRVTSFSHSLTKPNSVEFKLASSRVEGRLADIESAIADATSDIRGLEQRSINLSRRGWHDADEMKNMLDSLAAEFLLVGVEKNQFAFTSAIYCENGNTYSQTIEDSTVSVNHFKHLHISAGYIQHTQEPYIKYANGGRWDINEQDLTSDENGNSILYNDTDTAPSETAFYLYAICREGASVAQIVLSKVARDSDPDYLLMGILSSEFLDDLAPNNITSFRVLNRSNGYTQIAGGTITTEQIQDPTRSLIIDFQSNPPRIIARNGAKIIGNIEFSLTEENIQQVLERVTNIGGENLIETMGEVVEEYECESPYFVLFKQDDIAKFPEGTYVFSAESINVYNMDNPDDVVSKYLNIEIRDRSKAVGSPIAKIDPKTLTATFTLTKATRLGLRIEWVKKPATDYFMRIKGAMLQRGEIPTAYSPYVEHLTAALKGTTEIAGGLILSNLLLLKDNDGNVTAGMSGLEDNNSQSDGVTLFSGGTYEEALLQAQAAVKGTLDTLAKLLPILLTKTGTGSRIGCFNVEDENTIFVENAEKTEKITFDTELGITISKKVNGLYVEKVRIHAGLIGNNTIITSQIESGDVQFQGVAFNALPATAYPPNYSSSFVLNTAFDTYRMTGSITSIKVYIYIPTYQSSSYKHPFSFQIRNVTFGLLHISSGRKYVLARNVGMNSDYSSFTSYEITMDLVSASPDMILKSGEYKMYVDIGSATGWTKQNYEGESFNLKKVPGYPLIGYCPFEGTLYFSSQSGETMTEIASNGICVRSPYGTMQFLNSSTNGLFAVMSGLPTSANQVGQVYRNGEQLMVKTQ